MSDEIDKSDETDEGSSGKGGSGSSGQDDNITGPFLFTRSENHDDLFYDKHEQEISSALAKQLVKEIRAEGRKQGKKYKELAKQSFKQGSNFGAGIRNTGGGGGKKHPALEDMHGKSPANINTNPEEDLKDKSIISSKQRHDKKHKHKLKAAPSIGSGGVKPKKEHTYKSKPTVSRPRPTPPGQ